MTVPREVGVRSLLAPATLVALGVGLVCAVVGSVVSGLDGLGAAVLGLALVLGFLIMGQLPVAQAARGRGGLGAMLLLLGYLSRVLLLLVVFVLVTQAGAPDREVLGGTVIAVALGWTAGTVWTWLHWRGPVVDVELPTRRDPAER